MKTIHSSFLRKAAGFLRRFFARMFHSKAKSDRSRVFRLSTSITSKGPLKTDGQLALEDQLVGHEQACTLADLVEQSTADGPVRVQPNDSWKGASLQTDGSSNHLVAKDGSAERTLDMPVDPSAKPPVLLARQTAAQQSDSLEAARESLEHDPKMKNNGSGAWAIESTADCRIAAASQREDQMGWKKDPVQEASPPAPEKDRVMESKLLGKLDPFRLLGKPLALEHTCLSKLFALQFYQKDNAQSHAVIY